MRPSITLLISLLAVSMMTGGCANERVLHGPFVGTSRFDNYERVGSRVEASACRWQILVVIPFGDASWVRAYAEAMEEAPPEATGLSAAGFETVEYHWVASLLGWPAFCSNLSGVPAMAETHE